MARIIVEVIETLADLRDARAALTGRVGLVPTMGALHDGHLALVEAARAENDAVIATIFINPLQFAAGEDLERYPRDLPRDLALLEQAGTDLVFTPTPTLMYPPGFQTAVIVREVTRGLEGGQRPGHFEGVTTVVAKLFHLTQADRAYFGQKDAQQVVVLRRMVFDLNFPLEIVVCPTVREPDGLAMSSRNVYLKRDERQAATVLWRALQSAGTRYESGERAPERLRETMLSALRAEPLARIDYASVADPRTLVELESDPDAPMLLSLAVRIGQTHLIDTSLLPLALNDRAGLTATLGAPPDLVSR